MLNVKKIGMYLLLVLAITFFIAGPVFGDISPEARKKMRKSKGLLQREISAFDVQKNTISNIEFFTSNYGIFGLDVKNNNAGGGYWPRGSKNQYIFGGGTWFAAQKPWPNPEQDNDPETDDQFRKDSNGVVIYKNYVVVTYNPNSAESWFVPGRIDVEDREGSTQIDFNKTEQYRTFFSTDFNGVTGTPINNNKTALWPIWDTDTNGVLQVDRYFGYYQENPEAAKNLETTRGPAFISGEDIFATYKDTDLSKYDGGYSVRKRDGYPLYIQIENTIYSWGFGQYKDFIFLRWDFINFSDDTLTNCWHAPIMDVDIARYPLLSSGATNDRVQYVDCGDTTLGLATQFTNPNRGERGFGFGYLGFDYLESPSVRKYFYVKPGWEEETAVDGEGKKYYVYGDTLIDHLGNIVYDEQDRIIFTPDKNSIAVIPVSPRPNDKNDELDPAMKDTPYYFSWYDYKLQDTIRPTRDTYDDTGFPRTEKQFYPVYEQLNLVTFRNWSIADDKLEDNERYAYMSSRERDGDTGAGDKRFMMATGPYNMFPKDTSRVVVGIILARTGGGGEATGECADMDVLVQLDRYAQQVYDNSFQAPRPPDRTNILDWLPMNNGIIFKWDETAEKSLDINEGGLDFLGYKIYRARRPDLDTFNVSPIKSTQQYPLGVGPLGWKEIASFEIETPFKKSDYRGRIDDESYPLIDELEVMGYVGIPENKRVIRDTANVLLSDTVEIFSVKIMRIPKGALMQSAKIGSDLTLANGITRNYRPVLAEIDTNASLWSPYFRSLLLEDKTEEEVFNPRTVNVVGLDTFKFQGFVYDENKSNLLYDEVLVGKAVLNKSLFDYNPLFFKKEKQKVDIDLINSYLNDNRISQINPNELAIHKSYSSTITRQKKDENGDLLFEDDGVTPIMETVVEKVETPDVEIVYLLDTKYTEDNGTIKMDVLVPRSLSSIIRDSTHMDLVRDSLYSWIQQGRILIEYENDFADREEVRDVIIPKLMAEATNNRTFIDKGDDNKNGRIDLSDDPAVTEKLLNNVPYYYKVLAYDEGDPSLPTQEKLNFGVFGLPNVVQTYPASSPSGKNATIEIISQTDDLMAGVSNVNFFAVDQEKLGQIYGGDTLELTFTPVWSPSLYIPAPDRDDPSLEAPQAVNYNILGRNLRVENISTGKVLYERMTRFESLACASDPRRGQLTNNAVTYVEEDWQRTRFDINGDSLTFQHYDNKEVKVRNAHFTSGDFLVPNYCYSTGFSSEAKNLFGFEYDYTVAQYGGVFRPDSMYVENNPDSKVLIVPLEPTDGYMRPEPGKTIYPEYNDLISEGVELRADGFVGPGSRISYGGYDNGPGEYRLVFEEGGEEDITLVFGDNATEAKFKVPYLNVRMETLTELKNSNGDDIIFPELKNVKLGYPKSEVVESNPSSGGLSPQFIESRDYPHPANLKDQGLDPATFMFDYNIATFGWVDARSQENFLGLAANYTRSLELRDSVTSFAFTGKEGRYYLSGQATTLTDDEGNKLPIDFTHVINIGGTKFVIDYANKGRTEYTASFVWDRLDFIVSIDTTYDSGELYDTLFIGETEEIKKIDTTYYDEYDTTFNNYKDVGTMQDFKEGDQIRLTVGGGALGMPYYGAKVRAVVSTGSYGQKDGFTDKQLDGIKIVPNPYYINQQAEKSPYDTQLYFTRLPNECTIDIYTVAGDLLKTFDYKSGSGDYTLIGEEGDVSDEVFYLSDQEKLLSDKDKKRLIFKYKRSPQNRVGFDIWNLITSNGLRIQSQSLIAVIKTPDGAQTVKKFSVVVGSYRLISN